MSFKPGKLYSYRALANLMFIKEESIEHLLFLVAVPIQPKDTTFTTVKYLYFLYNNSIKRFDIWNDKELDNFKEIQYDGTG